MPTFVFYLLALVAILSGAGMLFQRQPLHAASLLVVCFLALAGMYAMLAAPLMAILQVLVYAGAIMALVVFVIMLLNVQEEDLPEEPNMGLWVGGSLVAVLPLFYVVASAAQKLPNPPEAASLGSQFGGIETVGQHLFKSFPVPFEAVSLLLTVAVVGVVVLAKRRA